METFKDRLGKKNPAVKVRNFLGANVEAMRHNLMPTIRKKPNFKGDFGSIAEFRKSC